jgi:hypothetical protein
MGVSVECFRFMQLSSLHWFDKCYGGEPMLVHYPNLDSYTLVIIPLASIRNYKKVIKINLTTTLNSGILRSLVQWFPNRGSGFYRSGNPTISSQIHNAFH